MSSDESALSGAERLRILILESQKEYDRTQQDLKEIDVLIRQTTAEVETLAQRNTQIGNRVRQMEMNLDTYPRDDIKEIYTAAHESQMRLFMMRGQLEQLQNRQQALEKHSQRLLQLVESASGIAPADVADLASGPTSGTQRDLVRVIEAQESERKRLAVQIHDGPAQSLNNLILQAEICERLFDTDPVQARVELGNLKNAVYVTFHRIREFISTLRPMMLDDLGLVPTLKQYVQGFEEKAELSTNFTVMGREIRMPDHVEVALFRAIQELLNNVHNHAHATHVQVTLDFQEQQIVASVEDDGSGFDAGEVQSSAQQRKGLGLSTIQERAEMLGGRVQFESRIGRGTKVRLEIPVA